MQYLPIPPSSFRGRSDVLKFAVLDGTEPTTGCEVIPELRTVEDMVKGVRVNQWLSFRKPAPKTGPSTTSEEMEGKPNN